MEELFGNFFVIIPIALVIFRLILSASGSGKKKSPPGNSSVRRDAPGNAASSDEMDPGMREFLRHFTAEPEPVRIVKRKTAPSKKAKSAKPQNVPPATLVELNAQAVDTHPADTQVTAAGNVRAAALREYRGVPQLPEDLSPIQQGFLWAEILGPAKALQD
ncbi:MAG: hypothetical protein LBI67_03085 [Treponema sp.]|jgi:hypothetical protein|nr:hypothetical protein [Treponema sp.]